MHSNQENRGRSIRLTPTERIAHSLRTRSIRGVALAVANVVGPRLAPRWWAEKLPWYAGRVTSRGGKGVRIDGSTFTLPGRSDHRFLQGLMWLGEYETFERYAIAKFLDPATPVIELGGSLGVVSCLTNHRLSTPGRHVVVEANPELIPILSANRDRNRCTFQIVNAALAYGSRTVPFHVSESIVESAVQQPGSNATTVDVEAITLHSILEKAGFATCTLICDIEGAEEGLFANEAAVIGDHVTMLIMEVHPHVLGAEGIDRLRATLQTRGFVLRWSRGSVWVLSK